MHRYLDLWRTLLLTISSLIIQGNSLSESRSLESFLQRLTNKGSSRTLTESTIEAYGTLENSVRLTSKQHIINGTVVRNVSSTYSYFAMPTNAPDSDTWLGCGASIISPTYGLTAAHCFGGGREPCSGPGKIGLWIGDVHLDRGSSVVPMKRGKSYKVTAKVHCHPHFDGHCSHGHDIVLLEIDKSSLPLPDWVKPVRINLDGKGSDADGVKSVSMGFGLTEESDDPLMISVDPPSSLREVNLTLRKDSDKGCDRVYTGGWGCSDEYSEGLAQNKTQQLCAGSIDSVPRDTCSGDSGAPLLDEKGVQIGIVSYGGGPGEKMTGDGRICADPKYLGIYSRVSAFADFIKEKVKDLDLEPKTEVK